MEHVISFLTLRDRKAFASVCKSFHAIHNDAPFTSAVLTHRNASFALRSRKIFVDAFIGEVLSNYCHDLSLWDLMDGPVATFVDVPNVKRVRYTGMFAHFATFTFPKKLEVLDIHAWDRETTVTFAFRIGTLRTTSLRPFLGCTVDRYEITSDDYELYKNQLPRSATIVVQGPLSYEKLTTVLHPKIELYGCNVESLSFPVPLRHLTIRGSNVTTQDMPHLTNLETLDLMDNDTLKQGPEVTGISSLNLMHTGIRHQVAYALSVLADSADYVGLSITDADFPLMTRLFQKRIQVLELCCTTAPCLPVSSTIGELRLHTPQFFGTTFSRRHCNYFVWKRGV